MEILVLNKDFVAVAFIDEFESLIWTDRYQEMGDFELYLPMDLKYIEIFKKDYYLWMKESEHVMIIEKIQIDTDVDTGTHLTVTGKSLEKILTRRIIWEQTRFYGTLNAVIKKMLTESFISPSIEARTVSNFIYQDSLAIDEIKIDKQYTGTEVYEAIVELCTLHDFGFMLRLSNDDDFIFNIYKGEDRSYDQLENPTVIFSPRFENLTSSEYFDTNEDDKNVALIAGEDDGLGVNRRSLVLGEVEGLDRRELYVDARDIQSEKDDGTMLSDEEYFANLESRGKEKMLDHKSVIFFTGEAETTRTFKYGKDFFMGDIVQVEDGYGHSNKARVVEYIFSQNDSGIQCYPTFQVIEEEEVN